MNEEEKTFFEQWSIYQNIIRKNYMYHKEIIQVFKKVIKDKQIFSVLDLGCGDSYIFANSLNKNQQIEYLGVDTSKRALEFSKTNLKLSGVKNEYLCEDFLDALEKLETSYDIIMIGYALHHLDISHKEKFFNNIPKILNKTGMLFFYDIYSKENETSKEYLHRACSTYRKKWMALTQYEMDSVIKHVQENDKVESERFYRAIMKKNGLNTIEKKIIDDDNLFAMYQASF